jgi:hypothetical protein
MKLFKKAIYLSVIVILIIQIYNKIIYGFETNNKIITDQTIEIGADGESYILPASIGTPGQILILNNNGGLEWGEPPVPKQLPTGPPVIFPYLRRGGECPEDTCFLPTKHKEFEAAQGYCMATSVFSSDPLNCNDEQWAGVFSQGLTIRESIGYCRNEYGSDAIMPTLNFFWPELAYILEDPWAEKGISKEIEYFTEEENNSIQRFASHLWLYADVQNRWTCQPGPYLNEEREKAILTRDISAYALGCLSATAMVRIYCRDRNSTDEYNLSGGVDGSTYDPELGGARNHNPQPFGLAEAPIKFDINVMSRSPHTQGMSKFRVLCIR